MIKAVLWDVDDTLFDHSGTERAAALQYFTAEGLDADETALRRWRRITDEEYARFTAGELTFAGQRRERVRRLLRQELSDSEADAWFDRYLVLFEAAWSAFSDVEDVFEALAAPPYRHGILSNSTNAVQERKLTMLGLRHRFEFVVCSDELGCSKPDPRAFLEACSVLGLPAGHVAYVGDRLDLDALGAQAAGLTGIWLNRTGSAVPVPDGIHHITTLAELPGVLRG
ncbi:HAD family hydrolase [Actinocorallia sp. B10E7]|uniref:HAD family hydrolase n=1 Tax=Actinocorallia sp. B10E7 TaxID=3153558 RepID=UPI00325D562E